MKFGDSVSTLDRSFFGVKVNRMRIDSLSSFHFFLPMAQCICKFIAIFGARAENYFNRIISNDFEWCSETLWIVQQIRICLQISVQNSIFFAEWNESIHEFEVTQSACHDISYLKYSSESLVMLNLNHLCLYIHSTNSFYFHAWLDHPCLSQCSRQIKWTTFTW